MFWFMSHTLVGGSAGILKNKPLDVSAEGLICNPIDLRNSLR